MQLTVSRGDLTRLLSDVSKVVEKRTTIPILCNIKLVASMDDRLHVTGTDLDIEISKSIPANITVGGTTTVNAARLYAIVAKLGAGDLSLALKDDTLTIKAGRSRFTLPTLPVSDFPEINTAGDYKSFDLDVGALLAPVKFSISTEETRYYLNGIYLHQVEGDIRAVSTDGHKLSLHQMPSPESAPDFAGVIIPRKTVDILSTMKDTIRLEVSPQKIKLSNDDTTIVSKLIDATYPDYMRVIPRDNEKIVTVDRAAFAGAVERAGTVISERGRAIKLALQSGSIELSVTTNDGSSNEELEADYSGAPVEIGLNTGYVLEMLASASGDTIEMAIQDPGSPVLFTNPSDANWKAVIMPVRV